MELEGTDLEVKAVGDKVRDALGGIKVQVANDECGPTQDGKV